jgi:hypothetical protein
MTTIPKIGGLGRLKNQGTPAIVNTQIVFIYLACDIKEKSSLRPLLSGVKALGIVISGTQPRSSVENS